MSFAAGGVFAGAAFLRAARSAAATLFVSAVRIGRAAAEGAVGGVGAGLGATSGSALLPTAVATVAAGFTWRLVAAAGAVPFEVAGLATAAFAAAATEPIPVKALVVTFVVFPILAPALIGAFVLGAFTICAFVAGAFDVVATLVAFTFGGTATAAFDKAALPRFADDAAAETTPFGAAVDRADAGPRAADRAALSVVRWAVFADRAKEAVAEVFPALPPARDVAFFKDSRRD